MLSGRNDSLSCKEEGFEEVKKYWDGRKSFMYFACCLCSENKTCTGCDTGECPDKDWCENRKCSISKKIEHCYECKEKCRKGLLVKIKPYAFTEFVKRYGQDYLLDCLERNERMGVIYHREGVNGDYDEFDDVETLIEVIRTGYR